MEQNIYMVILERAKELNLETPRLLKMNEVKLIAREIDKLREIEMILRGKQCTK